MIPENPIFNSFRTGSEVFLQACYAKDRQGETWRMKRAGKRRSASGSILCYAPKRNEK